MLPPAARVWRVSVGCGNKPRPPPGRTVVPFALGMTVSLASQEVAALLAALERLHTPVASGADFPRHAMEVIGGLLPDTVRTFDVIHTATGQVESQVSREVDNPEALTALVREFIGQNPVVPYLQQGGQEVVLQPTDFVTQRQFRQTGLYHECFRPLGIEYQIDVALAIPGAIGGMSISRRGSRNFSAEERQFVCLLQPHLARAHANCLRMENLQKGFRNGVKPIAATRDATPSQLVAVGLTDREIEVWHWIGEGKRDGEIATILGISPRTIQKHVQHVLHKLQVETRTAAVRSLDGGSGHT